MYDRTAPRRRCLAAAGVALALLAAGCGSSSSDSGSGSTGSASATGTAAAGSEKKDVKIAIAMTQSSVPYYETAKLGAEAAGTQDGNAKVTVQGPVNPTGSAAATIAQNLETSVDPDGFGVNPCILAGWTQVMNTLPRTVPNGNVIAWNCKQIAAPGDESPIKTYVGANDAQTGYDAATAAIKAAGLGPDTTGTAILGKCLEGVPILESRRAGAEKAVKELLPNVKPVLFVSKVDNAGALAAWTSALAKYPDLVYAQGACDQDHAALSTLKARGGAKDVAVAAIDPTAQQLEQIKNGEIRAATATAPWVIANVATHLLIDSARGGERPEGWVDTGVATITKDNAEQWLKAANDPKAAEAYFAPFAQKVLDNLEANTHPMDDAFAG